MIGALPLAQSLASSIGAAIMASAAPMTAPPEIPPGLTPGVTVWLYDLEGDLRGTPMLERGQTPNVARDLSFIAAVNDLAVAEMDRTYAGRVRGSLIIDETGTHAFRLTGADGARLSVNGQIVIDDMASDAMVELGVGVHPFVIDFFERDGDIALDLNWMPPGAHRFEAVHPDSLLTEIGQTHVVSPGTKRWYDQRDPDRILPGDGRALEAVHPGYDLVALRPDGFEPQVGALAFLPDGRLALVATWDVDGAVWILDGRNRPR